MSKTTKISEKDYDDTINLCHYCMTVFVQLSNLKKSTKFYNLIDVLFKVLILIWPNIEVKKLKKNILPKFLKILVVKMFFLSLMAFRKTF